MQIFLQNINRRDFIRSSSGVAAGLIVACHLPFGSGKLAAATANLDFSSNELPNAFVKISADNVISLVINKLEMGQGIFTSLAQLIAEELNCPWSSIECTAAPVLPIYNATFAPLQMAGGSTSVNSSWQQLRMAGAMARELLIGAAAEKWQVDRKSCMAVNGFIKHPDREPLSYGALADAATRQKPPLQIALKDPKSFEVIGKSMPRLDAKAKSNGTAIFGIDVRLPGMLYAVIARPPFGATLKDFDEKAARQVSGLKNIVRLDQGVAFIATSTWAATQARNKAQVSWNLSDAPELSQPSLLASYRKTLEQSGTVVKKSSKRRSAATSISQTIEAHYEFPYLAHACMEPLNCTIDFDGTQARIWAGHQMPTTDRQVAAKILNIDPEKVKIETTFAGGSFGRRASKTSDFVVEAAELAKQLKQPVKIVWTREDDMKGGYYRPLTLHKVTVKLDKKQAIDTWDHRIVGQSVMGGSFFGASIEKTGIDPTSVEGISDSPYKIGPMQLELHLPQSAVPTLWWRSVGHTHTAFVMETMIDELAGAAKQDPLQYRLKLLKDSPKHLAVLKLLDTLGVWKQALAPGRSRGLAIHESFQSVVAHIVEISIEGQDIKIHKITSGVHCGTVINPAGAIAQIESSIAYGLSACLQGEITLNKGQVDQSNFNDYPSLRFAEMPPIEVHFVKSSDTPTGLGEPGLPPLAPALANALFVLRGKRIRSTPFHKVLA